MPLQDLQKVRLDKLQKIKDAGVDPYPAVSRRKQSIADARGMMDQEVSVAGRVRSLRPHGKITFADLEDQSGRIQLLFNQTRLWSQYEFLNNLDLGDFLEVQGKIIKTQAGEITVEVNKFTLLTKSIRPLPSSWYGLKDAEERYRRRYLDLLLHPELREVFIQKSKFWEEIRRFLIEQGFLEVETPVLQPTTGGADARPFVTHHFAQDMDLYLRVSPELYLKRLLVGGFEKVFEIGRIFRNEGIDDEHLQDYTQMEFYWAYADYNELMQMVQNLYQTVIQETFGTQKLRWQDTEIDWSGEWPRTEYFKLLSEHWGVDAENLSVDELYRLAEKLRVEVEPNLGRGRLLDYIYKKTVRPKLIQPMFLINPPVDVEPLAKRVPGNPNLAQRTQILAMGSELGKGFSELNDPLDQKLRFEDQMRLREKGDEEAQMMDEDFVEALEYGMPPAAGFGMSERLFSMLANKPIREMVFFPTMRPAEKEGDRRVEDGVKNVIMNDSEGSRADARINKGDSDELRDSSPPAQNDKEESYDHDKENTMTREQAYELVAQMLQNKNLVKHSLAVEAIMRALARKMKEMHPEMSASEFDEEEWGLVGLLHDADYELAGKDPSQHTYITEGKIRPLGVSERTINGIRGHYSEVKPNRENYLEKGVYCADELSGLITAVTLVRPDKKLASVTVDNAMKKYKEKSFAAGALRHQIAACEEELGIPLRDFVELALGAMQGISDQLGL